MIDKVVMKPGRYSLERETDGAGDSGPMLQSININTAEPEGENGEIIKGCAIKCGSIYARSYQHQDWWMTTAIEEILEVSENRDRVKVRTRNSVYIIESF